MFEREPNIDIVFRNGLKDLEVLPPADVWDNIPPMPVRLVRHRNIYRIAAGFAILVSLSLPATWYFISNNNSLDQLALADDNQAAQFMDIMQASPVMLQKVPPAPAVNNESTMPDVTLLPSAALPLNDYPAGQTGPATELTAANENKSLPLFKDDDITIIVTKNLSSSDGYADPAVKSVISKSFDQRFMIGASVLPAYSFSAASRDANLAVLVNGEKARPSYTTGLTVGYKISDRLTINSGIGLSSTGQTVTGIKVFMGLSDYYSVKSDYLYSVETSAGPVRAGNTDLYLTDSRNRVGSLILGSMADPSKYNLSPAGSDIHQVFRYLELPLLLRYKVIDRRLGLNLAGGLTYGFLVDNFAYTRLGSEIIPVGYTEGVNLHSFSSQMGLGMEYNFSQNISFSFEPVLKYYLTPFSDLAASLYKPYAFGFYSGLFFKF